jgi:hypothetical protein
LQRTGRRRNPPKRQGRRAIRHRMRGRVGSQPTEQGTGASRWPASNMQSGTSPLTSQRIIAIQAGVAIQAGARQAIQPNGQSAIQLCVSPSRHTRKPSNRIFSLPLPLSLSLSFRVSIFRGCTQACSQPTEQAGRFANQQRGRPKQADDRKLACRRAGHMAKLSAGQATRARPLNQAAKQPTILPASQPASQPAPQHPSRQISSLPARTPLSLTYSSPFLAKGLRKASERQTRQWAPG